MGACIVSLNGSDYYYPCDKKDDLVIIDNMLVNVGSATITLYKSVGTNGNSSYPRVVCPTYQQAYYQSTANANRTYLTMNSFEFKSSHIENSTFYSLLILGVLICQFLKH